MRAAEQGGMQTTSPLAVLTFTNPLFTTYVIAASIMVIKVKAMSWLTVARMVKANAAFERPRT